MNQIISETAGILAMIIGVAILAVIVSRNSNTVGVIESGGNAFSQILSAAMSPVSGNRVVGYGGFSGSSIM